MLNNKQIKKLTALANSLKIKYQVGKTGVDQNVIALLDNALKAHELIKVYFNKSTIEKIDNLVEEIVIKTKATLVKKIGHMVILYRPNPKKKNPITL